MSIFIAILIGFLFERVQVHISASNYDSVYNGHGAIDTVNARTSLAPMQYRVLIPWLSWLYEKAGGKNRIAFYTLLKIAGTSLAFYAIQMAWGIEVALFSIVLLLLTIYYDYWDWGIELAGFAFAMTGDIRMAIVGVILHGLSRETVLIVPVLYYLKTGDVMQSAGLMIIAAAVYAIPRVWAGAKKLYCKRFMIAENLELLNEIRRWNPFFLCETFQSVVLIGLAVASIFTFPTGWPVVLIMLIAGITMGKIDETRVFAPVIPWVAAFLLR